MNCPEGYVKNEVTNKCLTKYQAFVQDYARRKGLSNAQAAAEIKTLGLWVAQNPNASAKAKINRQIRQYAIADGYQLPYGKHVPKLVKDKILMDLAK